MLKKWIYEGELNDQYNEFFVEEHQDIHGEDLWNLKYSMRQNGSMLPSFINTTLAKKVCYLYNIYYYLSSPIINNSLLG